MAYEEVFHYSLSRSTHAVYTVKPRPTINGNIDHDYPRGSTNGIRRVQKVLLWPVQTGEPTDSVRSPKLYSVRQSSQVQCPDDCTALDVSYFVEHFKRGHSGVSEGRLRVMK